MKKTKKLNPISLRLDPSLKDALERLAAADERSLSQYISIVLREHVSKAKK